MATDLTLTLHEFLNQLGGLGRIWINSSIFMFFFHVFSSSLSDFVGYLKQYVKFPLLFFLLHPDSLCWDFNPLVDVLLQGLF